MILFFILSLDKLQLGSNELKNDQSKDIYVLLVFQVDECECRPSWPLEVQFVTRITQASKCKSGLCLLQEGASRASKIAFFMFPATLPSHLALILADVARPTCTHLSV